MTGIKQHRVGHYLDEPDMRGISKRVLATIEQRGSVITLTDEDCFNLARFINDICIDIKSDDELRTFSRRLTAFLTVR